MEQAYGEHALQELASVMHVNTKQFSNALRLEMFFQLIRKY